MTELAGRTALVTGAAAGIGLSLAQELARRGATPILWDLDQTALERAVERFQISTGGRTRGYRCDVSDARSVYATADLVRRDAGDPDIVVNNAGVVSGAPLLEIADEKIRRTFEVNTLALYWVTKAFLPAMVRRRRGHVVTVASAAGLVGVARQTDYSASKHAAVGFDESLRVELRRTVPEVMTTVVCPYYVDTEMFAGVRTALPRLLPILRTDDVARRVADAIEQNRRMLVLPPIIRLLPLLRALPVSAFDRMMDLFGINESMDRFVGHDTWGNKPSEE